MVRNAEGSTQAVPITAPQQIVQRTIPALERRVDEVIAAKPPVIDFVVSSVQIIDSVGLNWLLQVQTRLETLGMKMRILDPSAIVSDVLLATRLDTRFTVTVSAPTNGENGETNGR